MMQTTKIIIFVSLIAALLTSQASAGCGRWVVRETTDYLVDPVFDEAVAQSTGPMSTVGADSTVNQSVRKEEESAGGTQAEETKEKQIPERKQTPVLDLNGKWAVELQQDSAQGPGWLWLDLILIQSGDRLQGYGTLSKKGAKTAATATGSASEDVVRLDVKLNGAKKDYRLDMALINTTLHGSYQLYESDRLSEKGNATARRSGD
jgi:hypothetical protein